MIVPPDVQLKTPYSIRIRQKMQKKNPERNAGTHSIHQSDREKTFRRTFEPPTDANSRPSALGR